MGLIVHLTDLHLGPRGGATAADDRKILVIDDEERMSRRDEAESAIKKLSSAIKANGRTISALVISGDITVASSAEGFVDLKQFLSDSFGELLPDVSRIVAVPGNHDVKWYERDPLKRYQAFNDHCVKMGFVTPPLEGLTLTGNIRRWVPNDQHALVDMNEHWAIVPINSAEFCGVRSTLLDQSGKPLPDDEKILEDINATLAGNPLHSAIFKQLCKAREYDIARVSKNQITAFAKTIEHVERKFTTGVKPLLLSTLHHQLSPVDEREEIKPFEALSNLGRVRAMLQERGISIIFHGHKHQSGFFWDSREEASSDGRTVSRHDLLIVSGGTIGAGGPKENFANVVEITPRSHGHDVNVWSLGDYLEDAKNRAKRAIFFDRRRLSPVAPSAGLIEGTTFDEVYARLEREAALLNHGRVNDLVVRITDGRTVTKPPANYPTDASGDRSARDLNLDDWFKDITAWWQSPLIEAPDRLFTHGRRLQLYDGKRSADQIKAIKRIIERERKPGNGRAVAILVDPETDTLSPESGTPTSFPAFCLVQLHINNDGGTDRLDATAYFRKQEMRYWWPVNAAEVKFIMSKVVEGMKDIEIGSITTITAIAIWQPSRSRVAIPKVDRLYLQDHDGRTMLSRMAAFLSGPTTPVTERSERDKARQMWRTVLDDIVPPLDSARDSIPLSVEGVGFLRRSVEAQLVVSSTKAVKTRLHHAAAALKVLEEASKALRALSTGTDLDNWKAELEENVRQMLEAKDMLSRLILGAHEVPKKTR